jgi:hypothetical protein
MSIETYPKYMFAIEEAIRLGYLINEKEGTITSPHGINLSYSLNGNQRYPTVTLVTPTLEKHSYSITVHKIIGYKLWGRKAFEPGIHVRHLDGNTLNNREPNLALGTPSENERDKHPEVRKRSATLARQAQGKAALNRKLTSEQAQEIRASLVYTETGKIRKGCLSELAKKYNVTRSAIWYIAWNINYVE